MLRWLALIALLIAWPAHAQIGKPDLVLTGEITGADHQTYKPVTFDVALTKCQVSSSMTISTST